MKAAYVIAIFLGIVAGIIGAVLMLSAGLAFGGEVYSWTDEAGIRHWSNREPAGVEVDVVDEIPAGPDPPARRAPSYTPVYIPRPSSGAGGFSVNLGGSYTYRPSRLQIEAERQLQEDRRERIEDRYWRGRGRKDPVVYREIVEDLDERREELRDSPPLYFQKRELRRR